MTALHSALLELPNSDLLRGLDRNSRHTTVNTASPNLITTEKFNYYVILGSQYY